MVTVSASHRPLLDTLVGILTIVRFSLTTTRQKVKNLRTHPQASILVLDPPNPYRTIELRAVVDIALDPDYAFADRLVAKYGGLDVRAMDRPGETRVVVTLRPTQSADLGRLAISSSVSRADGLHGVMPTNG
jgi:hypothetical protein